MSIKPDHEKLAACRALFIKYGGRHHELIEREMRGMGWPRFSRRILYARKTGRGKGVGWIDQFGWEEELTAKRRKRTRKKSKQGIAFGHRRSVPEPRAVATGFRRLAKIKHNRQKARRLGEKEDAGTRRHRDAEIPVAASLRHPVSASSSQRASSPEADPFQTWLKRVSPGMIWDWRHQQYIYERLQKVTDGTCKRLMIFLPPRHGKSELVTVRYAAWRLKREPTLNVILGSYNQRLANKFSRKIRRVLADDSALTAEAQRRGEDRASSAVVTETVKPGGNSRGTNGFSQRLSDSAVNQPESMFPFANRPINTVAEWETAVGGGLRAVGVGGGVTGFGAGLIVIDDPVKNRAQAESETFRENVWEWFNDDIYTRLEPGGSIVLIQTRWHEDDLAGRLLNEMKNGGEQWEIVNLPALAESNFTAETQRRGEEKIIINGTDIDLTKNLDKINVSDVLPQRLCVSAVNPSGDPLGRIPGEALCPARYDESALAVIKTKLGSYSFSALYQQTPTPADGAKFKRAWFKQIIDDAPPGLRWCRGYDLAVSTKTSADYTASFRCAKDKKGNIYIADGFRQRIEYPEQRRYIIERIKTERDTEHGIEESLHGKAIVQELRRDARLLGRAFKSVTVTTDKVTRALTWANRAEEGKIILIRGPWIGDFIDELVRFPKGRHDDQIDSVSIAIQMLEAQKGAWGF